MNSFSFDTEIKMWEAVKSRDCQRFTEMLDSTAVMVCGGLRCAGEEYAAFLPDFVISGYEVLACEIIMSTDSAAQVHYVIKTTADAAHSDLAGTFHVTSTWLNKSGDWKLIFNMDSRIYEQE